MDSQFRQSVTTMRRPIFAISLIVSSFAILCACEDTRPGSPWLERFDGGMDAPGPPPDVPDTVDARPDIDVPPAPDCQQSSSSLSGQAKRLADAEVALTVDTSARDLKVSPNGCYVGFKNSNGEVRIIDLTGERGEWTVLNPAVGGDIGFQAIAFTGPDQHSVWLGTSSGSIHHLSLDDFSLLRSIEPTRDLAEDFQFDHLDVSAKNRYLAWGGQAESPDGDLVGIRDLYDLRPAVNVETWETRSGGGAPIELVPGRSLVIVRTTANSGQVEIFDAAAGEQVRVFEPHFGGSSSSVWAATQSWFAVAHVREDGAAISRLDFDTQQMTVVDPDPRPSHYHDLYASPSGRWLLEWNFEHPIPNESEGAIRRYDMVQDQPPLQFGPNLRGFGRATDLVFSNVSDISGIQMYDPANGESLGKIGAFDGHNVTRVVGISANRLAVRWRDDNATKLSILTGPSPNQ